MEDARCWQPMLKLMADNLWHKRGVSRESTVRVCSHTHESCSAAMRQHYNINCRLRESKHKQRAIEQPNPAVHAFQAPPAACHAAMAAPLIVYARQRIPISDLACVATRWSCR